MLKELLKFQSISLTINKIEGTEDKFGLVLMPKGKVPLSLTFMKDEVPEVEAAIAEYIGLSESIASASNITEAVATPKSATKPSAAKSTANKAPTTSTAASTTPKANDKPQTAETQTEQPEPEGKYKSLLDELGI